MTSTIKYKGYTGRVTFDAEDNILFGEVIGLRDTIVFQGTTVEEIVHAFHTSVDSYRKFAEEHNQEPEKPFSGKIPFRTTPENHYRIYMAAQLAGKSINGWMNEVLAEVAQRVMVASEESDVILPIAEQTPARELESLGRTLYYALPGASGQKGTEEVPVTPVWPGVKPVRLIDLGTIGQLVAEEATQRVAQEATPVSGEKLYEVVADATQTAIEKIKEIAPDIPVLIEKTLLSIANEPDLASHFRLTGGVKGEISSSSRAIYGQVKGGSGFSEDETTTDISFGTGVESETNESTQKDNIEADYSG